MEKSTDLIAIICAAIFFGMALAANVISSKIDISNQQLRAVQQTGSIILKKLNQK